MFGKRSITFLLILSIVSSTFYLPIFAPKTQAFLGFGDIVVDIKEVVEKIVDGLAMTIAQRLVDDIVRSTVNWARTGFEGGPAYVTDPKQYFTDISDMAAGEVIFGSDLQYLCSPFQAQIRLALQQQYIAPYQFQCSLTQVVDNIDAFYNDFSQGGWDGWLSMTQNSSNNPYGAYLNAKVEMDSRIASQVGLKKEQLDRDMGFKGFQDCEAKNPPQWIDVPGGSDTLPSRQLNPNWVPGKAEGECIKFGPIETPGSTIKASLDKILPSPLEKLIKAEHIEQLISSFATGLLTRYVFGSRGLFASNRASGSSSNNNNNTGDAESRIGKIDIDEDRIPDGQDFDQDGKLNSSTDVCYHGKTLENPPKCVGSASIATSPYFAPVCQAIDKEIISLKDFISYITAHADSLKGGSNLNAPINWVNIRPEEFDMVFSTFMGNNFGVDDFSNESDAELWGNRVSNLDSATGEVLSSVQGYNSSYFDNIEIVANRLTVYIGDILESLMKDKNLPGSDGLGNKTLILLQHLRYFMNLKTQIGKCSNPDVTKVKSVEIPEAPPTLDGGGGGGGGGASCTDTSTETACTEPSNAGVVQRVKAYLESIGTNMSGSCGAFEITRRVAWALQNTGAGLIVKTGTNCQGYSTDVICYSDLSEVDILSDAGGQNNPQWTASPGGNWDICAPATDPGDPSGSY